MTGVLLLLARGTAGQLPRLRRWTAQAPPGVYLAARRLAGLKSATVAVLVATAVPIGILVYAAAVSRSMEATVTAKSATYAGTQHALVLNARPGDTVQLNGVGTQVSVIADARTALGGETQVLGVDRDTFARFAYSDPDVLGFRLSELVARLDGPAPGGAVPAIAVRCASCGPEVTVTLGRSRLATRIVGTADLFPGIRARDAWLLVVPRASLAGVDPYANRTEEVWTDLANLPAAQQTLHSQGQQLRREVTPERFIGVTQLLPVAWTFGYLQALAALTGLIAVAGLFLYLSARQRSTMVSYVMLRRIGISRRSHVASLGSEIGGLLVVGWALGVGASVAAVLAVHRLLDLNASYPPGAQLVIPMALLAVSAGLLLGVALLGSAATQRAADSVEPSALLRGGQ
jgi:putative ABC transport system permease protein